MASTDIYHSANVRTVMRTYGFFMDIIVTHICSGEIVVTHYFLALYCFNSSHDKIFDELSTGKISMSHNICLIKYVVKISVPENSINVGAVESATKCPYPVARMVIILGIAVLLQ